jgi:phosphopantothenoylcysteine decarboxylase
VSIILGLTGSVASILHKKIFDALLPFGSGYSKVEVVLTEAAKYFIPKDERLESGRLYWDGTDEWAFAKEDQILHIALRDRGNALVIAPCSANTLAKLATGVCDNLLTSVARAWDRTRPVIIAPAMNTKMWEHPITKKHLEIVKDFGYIVVPPQSKKLACGEEGVGAMADIGEIIRALKQEMQWRFPLEHCTGIPVDPHPGAFGYKRKQSIHTGIDLYTDDEERVFAIEAGTVVGVEPFTGPQDGSPWWNDTHCLLIEGRSGVICYGEIHPRTMVDVGAKIHAGQYIARVKRVIKEGRERPDIPGHRPAMLHLELYNFGQHKASNGFDNKLRDPTPYLLNARNRPMQTWTYENYVPGNYSK